MSTGFLDFYEVTLLPLQEKTISVPMEAAAALLEQYPISKFSEIETIAQRMGVTVVYCQLSSAHGFVHESGSETIIFVNERDKNDIRLFTIAHEIGHIVLKHSRNNYLSEEEKEDQANAFACHFVVLTESDAGRKRYLCSNKEGYRVQGTQVAFGVVLTCAEYSIS